MPKKGEYVRLKKYDREIKSSSYLNADFESSLVPKDNWKQNSNGSYTRNIKTMLLVVIAINWYMLMINSVSLLNQT